MSHDWRPNTSFADNALYKEISALRAQVVSLKSEVVKLNEQIEKSEKDAERYRWLTAGKRRSYVVDNILTDEEWGDHMRLEQAIDAAIAKEPK